MKAQTWNLHSNFQLSRKLKAEKSREITHARHLKNTHTLVKEKQRAVAKKVVKLSI